MRKKRTQNKRKKKNKKSYAVKNAAYIAAVIIVAVGAIILALGGETEKTGYLKSDSQKICKDESVILKVFNGTEMCEMNLSEYLNGVVSAEMPASYETEALKAQALAARSYTLYKMKNGGCAKYKGADICTSPGHCQAYLSEEELKSAWKDNFEKYSEKIAQAIEETDGYVITYNAEVIDALYSASCAGITEDSENVFSYAVPYLKSVESEDNAEDERVFTFKKDELISKLKEVYADIAVNGELKNEIEIISHYESGRASDVRIGNIQISAQKLRSILKLSSTMFEIKADADSVSFICKGYGHGVGLSQVGANGYAKKGMTAEQIVCHYYTGVRVEKLDNWI